MTSAATLHDAGPGEQRGSTLIVALVMLALLTLIALSAMKGTTTSIQVVGNAQFHEEAKAAAQKGIERAISNGDFKSGITPSAFDIDINEDSQPDFKVTFQKPECRSAIPDNSNNPLCSGVLSCYWTVWDFRAEVEDIKTGARVVVHQGVRTQVNQKDAVNGCLN